MRTKGFHRLALSDKPVVDEIPGPTKLIVEAEIAGVWWSNAGEGVEAAAAAEGKECEKSLAECFPAKTQQTTQRSIELPIIDIILNTKKKLQI